MGDVWILESYFWLEKSLLFFLFELVHLHAKVTSVSPIPVRGNIGPYEFIMHM